MEEIRIYRGKMIEEAKPETKSKWKLTRLETIRQILQESAASETKLLAKHPWYGILMNWLVALVVVVGLIVYGVHVMNVRTEEKAALIAATAFADYQAEQEAAEQARMQALAAEQQSQEAVMKAQAKKIAQVLYGIRNFEKKYGYSQDDLITYVRCILNRVDNPNYPNTIEEVIDQENQWVGYSRDNPMIGNYYQVAYKALEEWKYEEVKPVSTDHVWAEIGEDGIWLKDRFDTDGLSASALKSIYWHYSK